MTSRLVRVITSAQAAERDQSLEAVCHTLSFQELLNESAALEAFRHTSSSLYERVRACLFLYAIHRFHLPERSELQRPELPCLGRIPFPGYLHLLERRFEEAISLFLRAQQEEGPSDSVSSALAASYHRLAFQTLAEQVRRSVRSVAGNQWMFRVGHPQDQPLRVRQVLREREPGSACFPILKEATPVRMDLTHSAWSDIFFLGMDYPEGARVLNISIDLAVRGRDAAPRPPVEAYFRVIEEPVLRLASVDLGAAADITSLGEVFDFARDYLGLLKAALIASGLVPLGIEGSEQELSDLLARLVGPGRGIELISNVNGIPKGSRLAVSTNLLAALISACMRATGQIHRCEGALDEAERRTVAARAILGEWLAGSGGGWQDSGGVWPGIKLIQGKAAAPGDVEYGTSRGCLLPTHHLLDESEASAATRQKLQDSLVLVHGGMAQNVGPILEMVTEKYLLRSESAWRARGDALRLLDGILDNLRQGDVAGIGAATTRNFTGPIQTIVPWANNQYTETLIEQVRAEFGADFWGFWMLGGMSGGGMGFIFAPERKAEAQERLQQLMSDARRRLQHALPFAMEPVVYDFAINERGTYASLLDARSAPLPPDYYTMTVPRLVRLDPRALPTSRRAELDYFGAACRSRPELGASVPKLLDHLLPRASADAGRALELGQLLEAGGFDPLQHEQIRSALKSGRIGLAQNRLPVSSDLRDVEPGDVFPAARITAEMRAAGAEALARGEVAVVSLAAGAGSRWTQGAGVVKALHPFARLGGRYRNFIDVHLAKTRRVSRAFHSSIPHVFTTGHLTHAPIQEYLAGALGEPGARDIHLSPGRTIGLRLVPTVRDLRFSWEELPQQLLDEQAQKMRDSQRAALLDWARSCGEATDYTDNVPSQCLHPVGHWYEIPNLLKNGVLARLLERSPALRYLMIHNIDTLGADLDPGLLGYHLLDNADLTVEVLSRRLEDRGGGLARVDGRLRLVEGLAMPREEAEFALTYYNSMTTWVSIDALLRTFGLDRDTLRDEPRVTAAVRTVAGRIPTYVTLKDVKRRWGYGQEDVFPVMQFEKLWGDMTALPELRCRYAAVSRFRGQQLKEQAQLDGWMRDGSAAYVEALCDWSGETE